MDQLVASLEVVKSAIEFLKQSGKSPNILIKIARNMGDGLHGVPIIRHYRKLYPNACIIFLTEQRYHNVHEYNADIDKLFLLPNNLSPQTRLTLWNPIKLNKNIDIAIIPSINPFQYEHPENKWLEPHPNIADQYLYNAGITDLKPLGGREIIVNIDDNDKQWADDFLNRNDVGSNNICIEYNSYSATMAWKMPQYTQFVQLASTKGFKCISLAGPNESVIPGSIDMRGATWRQTVAVLNRTKYILGCSSGNTMLALASRPQPKLIELNAPNDCLASQTGYVVPGNQCINVVKPTPTTIISLLN